MKRLGRWILFKLLYAAMADLMADYPPEEREKDDQLLFEVTELWQTAERERNAARAALTQILDLNEKRPGAALTAAQRIARKALGADDA